MTTCYQCRDGQHSLCVGVPCECPCPPSGNEERPSGISVLREALQAARDLLVSVQHRVSYIPGQGWSTTMSEEERKVADGIASIDSILVDYQPDLRRCKHGHDHATPEGAKACGMQPEQFHALSEPAPEARDQ